MHWASPVAQIVKTLPPMWEVQSLIWEDTLKEGIATHSHVLAWKIHIEGACWATVHGVTKGRTWLNDEAHALIYNGMLAIEGQNNAIYSDVDEPQFSRSVMSDSLWLHGLQHARPPCLSPTPRACSNSCPLSWWFHPTISSSVSPFSSCLQSFPASGSFLLS